MEVLKLTEGWLQLAKQLMEYTAYCAGADFQVPVCRPFWSWTITAAFALAGLILFVIAKHTLKEQFEFYRNKKRLEARKLVADAQTMEKHRWVGDDHDIALTQEELATEIRKARSQMRTPFVNESNSKESLVVAVQGYLKLTTPRESKESSL